MLRVVSIVAAAAFSAAFVQPERWAWLSSNASGSVWYLDTDRSEMTGLNPRAWIRIDHSGDSTMRGVRETLRRIHLDCANFRYRILSASSSTAAGRSVRDTGATPFSSFRPIEPNSPVEDLAAFVCETALHPPAR